MNRFFDLLMWYLNSCFEHLLVYGVRTYSEPSQTFYGDFCEKSLIFLQKAVS